MQVISAPFGANAPRVSAADRDTLVSTTGATWYSPDGQPIARSTSRIGQMLEQAIRSKGGQPEQVSLPIDKRLPMNRPAVLDAVVIERYRQKADAFPKLTLGWPVPPKFVDFDARSGVLSEFCSADFEAEFQRNRREPRIKVGATIPGSVFVPNVKSRNERRLARLKQRKLEHRDAVAKSRGWPEFEIDHSPLNIIIVDYTQKERVR